MIRPRRRRILRPWLLLLALSCAALAGCPTSTRQHVVAVGNVVASVTDAAGAELLAGYCRAQMRAIGREGTYAAGRCTASGPRAGTPSTEAEETELVRVRAAWRVAIDAHEVVARSHNALVSAIAAADAIDNQVLLSALSHAVTAYDELVRAAAPLGLRLPSISGGER